MKILIGDDKQTFLLNAGQKLPGKGWEFIFAGNLKEASDFFQKYDCVVMVVNLSLFQVDAVALLASNFGCPVICLYDESTKDSLIDILNTGINLVGCIAQEKLSAQLEKVLTRAVTKSVCNRKLPAETSRKVLTRFQDDLQTITANPQNAITISDFMGLATHGIAAVLENIQCVTGLMPFAETASVCHVLQCPKQEFYEKLLRDTVQVLEDTKDSFKSRRLAELRRNLQRALNS